MTDQIRPPFDPAVVLMSGDALIARWDAVEGVSSARDLAVLDEIERRNLDL